MVVLDEVKIRTQICNEIVVNPARNFEIAISRRVTFNELLYLINSDSLLEMSIYNSRELHQF